MRWSLESIDGVTTSDGDTPVSVFSEESAGATALNDDPDWWAGARLLVNHGAPNKQPVELGSGSLAEMIHLASSRPESERPRLAIQMELGGGALGWAEIAALAARPDRPTII